MTAIRKALQAAKERDIAVVIRRDQLGSIYSAIVNKADRDAWGRASEYVVDRKSRLLDNRVIQRRAEMLAAMLGAPLEVDLEWHCVAAQKLVCRCPKCVQKGRA